MSEEKLFNNIQTVYGCRMEKKCGIVPCPCGNRGTLQFVPLPCDLFNGAERESDEIVRGLINRNVDELRKMIRLPFLEFWSVALFPRDDQFSVSEFITLTSFRELELNFGEEAELLSKFACKLMKRLLDPESYLSSEEGNNKLLELWVSQDFPGASIKAGIISSEAFFNVVEVIYKYGKPRRRFTRILEKAFSNSGIMEVISYPLGIFEELINHVNAHLRKYGIKGLLEEQENRDKQSKCSNLKSTFTIPQRLQDKGLEEYVLSRTSLMAVCSGAREIAMAFTLCPSLTGSSCGSWNYFLLYLSIAYRIISKNLFSSAEHYKNPQNDRKASEVLFKEMKAITNIPITDLVCTSSETSTGLLLKMKCLVLFLMERYFWFKFDSPLLDCLEEGNSYSAMPESIMECITTSHESSAASSSGVDVIDALPLFFKVLSSLEQIDREIATKNPPTKYVYLLNAPLIADINVRLNLFERIKHICDLHRGIANPYFISHIIDTLAGIKEATIFMGEPNEPVIHQDNSTDMPLISRMVEMMPVLDAPLAELLLGSFKHSTSEAFSFLMNITGEIDHLSDDQIIEAAACIVSHNPKAPSYAEFLASSTTPADVRDATLALDQKAAEKDKMYEDRMERYETLVSKDDRFKDKLPIIYKYYANNENVYLKSSRKTKLREELKRETGLDDGIIEGWYLNYKNTFRGCERDPMETLYMKEQGHENSAPPKSFSGSRGRSKNSRGSPGRRGRRYQRAR